MRKRKRKHYIKLYMLGMYYMNGFVQIGIPTIYRAGFTPS